MQSFYLPFGHTDFLITCRTLKSYFPGGEECMDSSSGKVHAAHEQVLCPSLLKAGRVLQHLAELDP